jgi:hypothetical protein
VAVSPWPVDELLEHRPGQRADVEPGQHGVRQLDDPCPEPIAAAVRQVLDVPRRGQGGEEP